jgi:hypothetical protein
VTTVEGVLSRLQGVRRYGSGWQAQCPAHEDHTPSLSINERDGKILVHCHAGCSQQAVLAALGIEAHELFLDSSESERQIVATYDYEDEQGKMLYQVVRFAPKDFRQRRPNGSGWVWNLNGVRRVLHGLTEVLSANSVLVCEGEKDCGIGRELGFTATCNPGGAGKWRDEYSDTLQGKRVAIVADSDEPGRKHAEQVAASLAGKVESLKVFELPGAKDLSEWIAHGGTHAALSELIDSAPEWKPHSGDAETILRSVFSFIRRFVSLSDSQARVLTLWVVHTHAFPAASATPYMAINSPEKQSGKTRLLEVLNTLVASPWMTGRVTAAVLTRKIDKDHPTLLLDESDAAFGGEKEYAEALRGILNTGYVIGGSASCCVGQGAAIGFKDFSTFCPKAIAGIGYLPDTVADRSIPIRLKRAAPGEVIERFRRRDVESEAATLRDVVSRWCLPIEELLRGARPELPDELSDRQQDCAEPLLAIADAAGGEWPTAARVSLVELCAEAHATEKSIGVQLLADIREIFIGRGADRISSADLASALGEIETSPWGEWGKSQKPISAPRLARLLGRFGITPGSVRVGEKTPKGYRLDDFSDAFTRYLRAGDTPFPAPPLVQGATPQQPNVHAGDSYFLKRNTTSDVAAQKCEIANTGGRGCGVALSKPPTRAGENEGQEACSNSSPGALDRGVL